ncbi:hypothetical protein FRX31_029071 [Thalictrum thalictroides]|uniref:Uncharacterized protein n=1 Tax=Thalictrum thalictroides TaxID=46969 RepID=A0A7J6V8A5_THATH|nr:hypothetical protein FRX31_029071 [Thalictrum thalictroides]
MHLIMEVLAEYLYNYHLMEEEERMTIEFMKFKETEDVICKLEKGLRPYHYEENVVLKLDIEKGPSSIAPQHKEYEKAKDALEKKQHEV